MKEVLCWRLRLENSRIVPREDNELWAPPSSSLEMESERRGLQQRFVLFAIVVRLAREFQKPVTIVNVLFHLGHSMHSFIGNLCFHAYFSVKICLFKDF